MSNLPRRTARVQRHPAHPSTVYDPRDIYRNDASSGTSHDTMGVCGVLQLAKPISTMHPGLSKSRVWVDVVPLGQSDYGFDRWMI